MTRPDGVYLDDVERLEAEKVRAEIEGREPDFDNPPATVGTVPGADAPAHLSKVATVKAEVEPKTEAEVATKAPKKSAK